MNTLANELVSIQTSKAPAPSRAERQTGGLVDREGGTRVIFDIDGTREAAPQGLLPSVLITLFGIPDAEAEALGLWTLRS